MSTTSSTTTKTDKLQKVLNKFWGDKTVYNDDPCFYFTEAQWSCDPESMCNTRYTVTWRTLYYLGDVNLIRKFMNFLRGKGSFQFDGKVYNAENTILPEGEFNEVFGDDQILELYLNQVPEYTRKFRASLAQDVFKEFFKEMAPKFLAACQGA